MPGDIREAQHAAVFDDVQRTLVQCDAIRSCETGGDRENLVRALVMVAIEKRVNLAGVARAHVNGAVVTERERARVLDAIGINTYGETRRQTDLIQGRRRGRRERGE